MKTFVTARIVIPRDPRVVWFCGVAVTTHASHADVHGSSPGPALEPGNPGVLKSHALTMLDRPNSGETPKMPFVDMVMTFPCLLLEHTIIELEVSRKTEEHGTRCVCDSIHFTSNCVGVSERKKRMRFDIARESPVCAYVCTEYEYAS